MSISTIFNALSVSLLLPHVATILELIQRCLADSDRTESTVRLAIGLIGDLADSFPKGEIKQLLLAEWIAAELRSKGRGQSPETKRTIKWARDVSRALTFIVSDFLISSADCQARRCITALLPIYLFRVFATRFLLLLFDDALMPPTLLPLKEAHACSRVTAQ